MAKKAATTRKRSKAQCAKLWDTASNSTSLLGLLPITSEFRRKRRMCALACGEIASNLLSPEWQRAVEFAVKAEAGQVDDSELIAAIGAAITVDGTSELARAMRWALGTTVSHIALRFVIEALRDTIQIQTLRDIFGNPFHPATLDPRWLTSTVLDLARTIYDERAFERMPILADALMDAGCDSEEVINHCRSEGLHVRGCWVVDLLTGSDSDSFSW